MKRKKKWVVESKIKRINWKVIPLKDFTDKALWTRLDEERLASDTLIVELEARTSCNNFYLSHFVRMYLNYALKMGNACHKDSLISLIFLMGSLLPH